MRQSASSVQIKHVMLLVAALCEGVSARPAAAAAALRNPFAFGPSLAFCFAKLTFSLFPVNMKSRGELLKLSEQSCHGSWRIFHITHIVFIRDFFTKLFYQA